MKIPKEAFALVLLMLTCVQAIAHPHAWIVLRSGILVNDKGQITGLSQTWEFDDGYAATALEGLDTNADGQYSEQEIKPLTDENIASLKEFDYFTSIRLNGLKKPISAVTKASQKYENKLLSLTFEVPLIEPIELQAAEVVFKVYDPEYFIEYNYAQDAPYRIIGTLPAGCTAELRPLPTDEEMNQTRDFLADKPPDWKPETAQDFGEVFAQPLVVNCKQIAAIEPVATDSGTSGQPIDKSKLLVQQRGEGARVAFIESPALWVQQQQRAFYGKLSGALRNMQSSSSAAWTLLGLSFAYGIFHAAGPGHGKAVVSTWLLATESDLRRGVLIAFLSALIQALTAIALVSALFMLVASAGAVARNVAGYLESASYLMIAGLGLYLIWSTFSTSHAHAVSQSHIVHDHHHHNEHCDHKHVAAPSDLRGEWSFAKAFSLAFAVGIRPCTGAILVLVFANSIGLYWAGILSTFAMGIGVFIAISAIAAVTVYARRFALGIAKGNSSLLHGILKGARVAGGIVIAVLGAVLFIGSLSGHQMMI